MHNISLSHFSLFLTNSVLLPREYSGSGRGGMIAGGDDGVFGGGCERGGDGENGAV